jgi:hypothetical protein
LAYQVVDGQLHKLYNPYHVTFTFTFTFMPIAGEEAKQCMVVLVEWKAEFVLLSPEIPPPANAKDAALGFL